MRADKRFLVCNMGSPDCYYWYSNDGILIAFVAPDRYRVNDKCRGVAADYGLTVAPDPSIDPDKATFLTTLAHPHFTSRIQPFAWSHNR